MREYPAIRAENTRTAQRRIPKARSGGLPWPTLRGTLSGIASPPRRPRT